MKSVITRKTKWFDSLVLASPKRWNDRPSPQVGEQCDQLDHSETTQSTGHGFSHASSSSNGTVPCRQIRP